MQNHTPYGQSGDKLALASMLNFPNVQNREGKPPRAFAVPVEDAAADDVVLRPATDLGIAGFSAKSDAGATAIVRVGTNKDTGIAAVYVNLAAGESVRDVFTPPLDAERGIYLEVTSGVLSIVFHMVTV